MRYRRKFEVRRNISRSLSGRKGDLIQPVPIFAFFILLIVTILLMVAESGRIHTVRPELEHDLQQQYVESLLVSIVRSNAGQGNGMSIADVIIQNQDGSFDKQLLQAFQSQLSGSWASITIEYPDKRGFIAGNNQQLLASLGVQTLENLPYDVSWNTAKLFLPGKGGNIQVTLELTTLSAQTQRLVGKPPLLASKGDADYQQGMSLSEAVAAGGTIR